MSNDELDSKSELKQFVKYSSIENTYQQKVLDAIVKCGYDAGEWVVTEKAHGANACFIVDEHTISYGKRTATLSEDEARTFYNSLEVFQRYLSSARKLWELLEHNGTIIIYGELIGGSYPNIKPPTASTTVIQKGVHYCPQNEFYAFDIRLLHTYNQLPAYVDYDTCVKLFERVGLPYAKPLFRGTFSQAVEWSQQNNDAPTTIPELFGYLNSGYNIREGHVLKPVMSECFANGHRVILKDKNERFSERTKNPRHPRIQEITEDLQTVIDSALEYITNTRLDNVLSKEGGEVSHKNIGKLMGLLTQDALKDWKKEWEGDSLKKPDQKQLGKVLNDESRKFVLARLVHAPL